MELTIDQALQQGVAAHKEGRLQEAEPLYRAILRSQPLHPDANHNLGLIAISVDQASAALPLFKTALEANPKIEQFWLSYIDVLIKEKQFDNAKKVLGQAETQGVGGEKLNVLEMQLASINQSENVILENPSQEQLSTLKEHFQSGRLGDAEELAIFLTHEFSKHPFGWKVLGAVLEQSGRRPEALNAHQTAVILSPQDAGAHNSLGNTLKELNRLDEAEASYRHAIALKPDFAVAHNNLGSTLQALGRLGEAEATYSQAIALKPDFAEVHNNLGSLLQELGKLDEAEASLTQAITFKPDLAEAHSNIGALLQVLGRVEEAEVSCRYAIALKPGYAEAHLNLGVMLQVLGRVEEAEASYRHAIALKPGHVEAHFKLGVMLQVLGRVEEAEASYRHTIALKPSYAESHFNLGVMLNRLGRLDEAEANYSRVIALKPDYAEAHNNFGNTLKELGRLDEAEESYMQAIELKPDFSHAFWNLSGCEDTIRGAEYWIDKCLVADANNIKARLTKAALRFYQGDSASFDNLMQSEFKKNAYMRSFSWVFSLPNLPELYFNRWQFFDSIVKKSIISKPFYEFGVWRASSFKYLIKHFKKGYGFDTFTGLPEDWYGINGSVAQKAGDYSSDRNIPNIKGGEFIVGKFEDTLPVFFSEIRPMASVINFDADLYSSTICALNFSKPVINKDTILIFDEFIINESWEQDEFKALNEFCSINNYSYDVIAISFFTKQVAVKLIDI
jgi:Flp pilus assembly protein TadD